MKKRPTLAKQPSRAEVLLAGYCAHARKHGTELVMETAKDELNLNELVRLQIALDAIDEANSKARRFGVYRKPRLTARTRVLRLLGLEEETEG